MTDHDINNKYIIPLVLEVGKPKIKVPTDWMLGQGPLSGFQAIAFLLYPHMGWWGVLFVKGALISLWEPHPNDLI